MRKWIDIGTSGYGGEFVQSIDIDDIESGNLDPNFASRITLKSTGRVIQLHKNGVLALRKALGLPEITRDDRGNATTAPTNTTKGE